ncbi:MAG: hypothetical protein U0587_04335 [Candidatus Binatia bacterium]
MKDSIEQLISLSDLDDASAKTWRELEPLWIDAIDRRFQECRGKIPVLAQLAERAGIQSIRRLDDVVPLLFAHTVYKSYPESFIDRGRWDRMCLWLDTLSKYPVKGVEIAGVQDADAWIKRLHSAGHFVFATSGTSGKLSFLNQSAADVAFTDKVTVPKGLQGHRRPIFVLGPRKAPNRPAQVFNNIVEKHGRPGAVYFLSDEELRISDLSMLARMRKKIGDGTAAPSEIAAFEQAMKARRTFADERMVSMTEAILAHREEPSVIVGMTPQLYAIVQAARARGLKEGCFHPDTYVISGGGTKGFDLPNDHLEQIMTFMGLDLRHFTQGYGMQEASTGGRMFDLGRYEFSGWVVPLILDDAGEHLLETREGQVTGRMGLFDVSIDGRWGGIISGDRVVVDYSPSRSGRTGPAILAIARYSELEGGDDKLTCAGTVESFVRGAVGE